MTTKPYISLNFSWLVFSLLGGFCNILLEKFLRHFGIWLICVTYRNFSTTTRRRKKMKIIFSSNEINLILGFSSTSLESFVGIFMSALWTIPGWIGWLKDHRWVVWYSEGTIEKICFYSRCEEKSLISLEWKINRDFQFRRFQRHILLN